MLKMLAFICATALSFAAGPSSVFVIHAGAGSLTPNSGMQKEKQYTLVLSNVSQMISLGSSSTENTQSVDVKDFFTEWRANSSALAKTPAHGALRALHDNHPFSSNVNIVELTYTANTNSLKMVVTFLNYMAKQPAMKAAFALDHPMLVISENALPPKMVQALKSKLKPVEGQESAEGQSHGEIVK